MTPASWPCLLGHGQMADEMALSFDQHRRWRLLIVPALFEEANRLRRFTVEVMRRLDNAGVDSFLPDLPGCMSDGKTYQEAVSNAETVIADWIETARALGRSIPEPRGKLMYA